MLAEKQKVRLIYGNIKEYQFRKIFDRSAQMKGQTSLNLLQLLETRLSNIVYKTGFAATLAEARQLVSHGAFEVSADSKPFHKVDCSSYQVRPGTIIQVRAKARQQNRILNAMAAFQEQGHTSSWLNINHGEFRAEIVTLPDRDQLPQNINENLIVELYSK
jgi:small subunit ribosomal protein S4